MDLKGWNKPAGNYSKAEHLDQGGLSPNFIPFTASNKGHPLHLDITWFLPENMKRINKESMYTFGIIGCLECQAKNWFVSES